MTGLSEAFNSLADVKLLVEEHSLPAHKVVLAANSCIFADLFASSSDATFPTEVPLSGEAVQDVTLVLAYLYANFTFETERQPIKSVDVAKILARFAYKYGMQQTLASCAKLLIEAMGSYNFEKQISEDIQHLLSLSSLAEQCVLPHLLAHCEAQLVRQVKSELWHSSAVVFDQISQSSLLRILRAYQTSIAGLRSCPHCGGSPRARVCVSDVLQWHGVDGASH